MCESTAYLVTNRGKQKIMEKVTHLQPRNNKVYLKNLLGEQKIIDGFVKEVRLMEHKIYIAKI